MDFVRFPFLFCFNVPDEGRFLHLPSPTLPQVCVRVLGESRVSLCDDLIPFRWTLGGGGLVTSRRRRVKKHPSGFDHSTAFARASYRNRLNPPDHTQKGEKADKDNSGKEEKINEWGPFRTKLSTFQVTLHSARNVTVISFLLNWRIFSSSLQKKNESFIFTRTGSFQQIG